MKKFLSIFLAVAFVFSAMCMSVLAADETTTSTKETHPTNGVVVKDKQYWVVGEQGKDDSLDNGKGNIPANAGGTANITVNFNKDNTSGNQETPVDIREHRYAVDIVYAELVINLGSVVTSTDNQTAVAYHYVWNVNTYQYDLVIGGDEGATDTVITTESTDTPGLTVDLDAEYTISNAFQIINHSDLPIHYSAVVAASNANETEKNFIEFEFKKDNSSNATLSGAVDAVIVGTAQNDKNSGTVDLIAKPSNGNNWLDVINALSKNKVTSGETAVGTITITISSTAPNAGGNS